MNWAVFTCIGMSSALCTTYFVVLINTLGESNENHYLVGTQDPELRIKLKDKPGINFTL